MARNKFTIVGFADEAVFLRASAKVLGVRPIFAKTTTYPAGEMAVIGPAHPEKHAIIVANIKEAPDSLFRVLLLAEALRIAGAKRLDLIAPWIAYGRQDRAAKPGEAPAGIVVARLLSSVFRRIVTLDMHSERFWKAFKSKMFNVLPPIQDMMPLLEKYDAVAAPDHGARERAKWMAKGAKLPLIQLEKKRSGMHVSTRIVRGRLDGKRVLIVDDMADSGSTLFEAARVLRQAGAKRVDAFVTHAIDLKTLKRKSHGRLGAIYAGFDHASETYAPWCLY